MPDSDTTMTFKGKQPNCPNSDILDLFVSSQLPEQLDSEVEIHVESCQPCQAYLVYKSKRNQNLFDLSSKEHTQEKATIYSKPEISGYSKVEFYKSGGQGVVFKAWDDVLERQVAVKILKDYSTSETGEESSLIMEARAIARLSHPNIVKLHGLVWTAQGPCMIMDWVEGESLSDKLKTTRSSQTEAVELLVCLCDALAKAHAAGILHRDIKPSNILLKQNSFKDPMLCDFGLAKLRRDDGDYSTATVGVGTAGYMPPEMISKRFGKVSASADIYSIGAVLYRLLTGRMPHESPSVFETMERTCDKDVPPPTFFEKVIPRDLETICLKCMQRDPAKRYLTVMSLKSDLEKFLEKRPVHARRAGTVQKLKTWSREHPWVAGLSAMLFGVLLTSVILLSYALNRAIEGERKIEQELARTTEIFTTSAPLVKSYIQLGILKDVEIKKIKNLAALLKEMGTDSPNLRQRFDLIYVGLELADELKRVKGQEKLGLDMTRQAKHDLKKLIDEHSQELDQEAFYLHEGKIAISLLDQALVRYGHCCIQLALILQELGQDSNLFETEALINEASKTVQIVIDKNPEVDEAFTDQANYLAHKSLILKSRGDFKTVAHMAVKVEAIHARMARLYPDAPEKINYWLLSVQELLRTFSDLEPHSVDLQNTLARVREEMQRIRTKNHTAWKLTAEAFSGVFLLEARTKFGNNQTKQAAEQLQGILEIWREITAVPSPLPLHLKTFMNIGIETMAAMASIHELKYQAITLYEELERFFKARPEEINSVLLAELYIRSPLSETRSFAESARFLNSANENSNIEYKILFRYLCGIQSDPEYEKSKQLPSFPPEWWNLTTQIRVESLINHNRPADAAKLLTESSQSLNCLPNMTIDSQIKLAELRRRLATGK